MLEQITDRLEEYFKNSKQEFSFGVQNFQGIREYTEIPLAPLTLLYGQNSAGKSTIHDAIEFIHGFFSGKWDEKTVKTHLNRWANQNRKRQPLSRNFLGKKDDVVVSVTTSTDISDFWQWESYHSSIKHSATGLSDILFNIESNIPFRMDVHFSGNLVEDWHVRQCRLFLCDEIFADFVFDDFLDRERIIDEYGLLRINKNHPVYELIDNYYDGGLGVVSKRLYHNEGEEGSWFLFFDMDANDVVTLKDKIIWSEVDECLFDRKPTPEIIEFRRFILSLLQIPSIAISTGFDFSLVPPLRPIPSKESAVFRFRLGSYKRKDGWSFIAEQILSEFLYDKANNGLTNIAFVELEKINHWLSHEIFLALPDFPW